MNLDSIKKLLKDRYNIYKEYCDKGDLKVCGLYNYEKVIKNAHTFGRMIEVRDIIELIEKLEDDKKIN